MFALPGVGGARIYSKRSTKCPQEKVEATTDKKPDLTSNTKHDYDQLAGLSASVQSYFSSGEFSDLTICTINQEFKVHRLVVCGQSEYFSRMFKRDWVETTESLVRFEDDDPEAIQAMIQFMYGIDYDSSNSGDGRPCPLLFAVKMYQVADKYAVPRLQQRAKKSFQTIAKTCWQMDDFSTAIAEAYRCTTKTDRSLRDPLVEISREHIDELRNKDEFQKVLEETTGFAADLVQSMAQSKATTVSLSAKKYRCPSCSSIWDPEVHDRQPKESCPYCGWMRTIRTPFIIEV
ncbi:hypothetical protein ASPCADRAFT_4523 [Aspergillus carbonarius ITEM 5010]|uniref:BTB domain-containing protein n=1 Tax=Aspergillus carbonarius (strain ITEM 5010) TaxID=602072 RepID=A0A1R3RPU5_ASPC5|nr:hypothetical protein ASPCADRAFT_4523 [Aspergillus carbonarius ITEM 5010]